MASLRPVEERDSKGNTLRTNPTITFKQDQTIRVVVGKHDWRLEPNPAYHAPITAQVQDGKIRFFTGTPDSTASRTLAKELPVADVPTYIIDQLQRTPIKVREARPMVYEVKIAMIDNVETTVVEELHSQDGMNVTLTPVAPDTSPEAIASQKRRKQSRVPESLRSIVGEDAVEA
jgi:hypothetical protein